MQTSTSFASVGWELQSSTGVWVNLERPLLDIQLAADLNERYSRARSLEVFFAPRNAVAFNRPPHEVSPWAGNYGAKIDPIYSVRRKV
jgi:hypothetical protein